MRLALARAATVAAFVLAGACAHVETSLMTTPQGQLQGAAAEGV